MSKVEIPRRAVAEFCRRNHIRRLSLFGSELRDDFEPHSDIDALVEWEPGQVIGWNIVAIEHEFGKLFEGRPVQMLNPACLNRRLRDEILGTAEVIYDQGAE